MKKVLLVLALVFVVVSAGMAEITARPVGSVSLIGATSSVSQPPYIGGYVDPDFREGDIAKNGVANALFNRSDGKVWAATLGTGITPSWVAVRCDGKLLRLRATPPAGYKNRLRAVVWVNAPASGFQKIGDGASIIVELRINKLPAIGGSYTRIKWKTGEEKIDERTVTAAYDPGTQWARFVLEEGEHSYSILSESESLPAGDYTAQPAIWVDSGNNARTAVFTTDVKIKKIELQLVSAR